MRCKGCHASRCFKHLLLEGVHSAEAILLAADKGNVQYWHERHLAKTKAYVAARDKALEEADRFGIAVPSFKDKLASLAIQFRSCRPANESFTKPGWYDVDGSTSNSVRVLITSSLTRVDIGY